MDFMEPQEIAVFDGETPSFTAVLILAREERRLWSMAGTRFSWLPPSLGIRGLVLVVGRVFIFHGRKCDLENFWVCLYGFLSPFSS